jgi:predicted amidophosphoribosyltransferase
LLATQLNRDDSVFQSDYPFAAYSLLNWTIENDEWVRELVHAFKRGHSVSAAVTFAGLLSDRMLGAAGLLANPVFVVPPSRNGRLDHASLLALELCKFFPNPSVMVLKNSPHEKHRAQKEKTAIERAGRRFLAVYPSGDAPDAQFVFIDDVITSGSTAMAAFMALGDPKYFQSWTLVSRPKLASG